MALTAAELKIIVEASVKDAINDLNKAGTAVEQTGQKSKKAGAMSQAAGKAFVAGGAAIGATYFAAVEQGAEFQQQLADINTVARLSESDTAALGDALQQMSRDTGISTDELTASMYDMVSAGTITSEQLSTDLAGSMEVVNSAATLAIGGMGNLAGTTDALTSALNAYGLDASKSAEITDMFAVAIEKGKVTADEIGASLSNVAPIAANAGIGIEEIAATYATLTANGVPAAEATTQMRAAIVALMSPNEKLKDIMADTGLNFAKIAKEQGLQVALQKLRDVTIGANKALDATISGPAKEFPDRLKANQEALGLTNTEMQKLIDTAKGPDGVEGAYRDLAGSVASGDAGLSDALGRVEGFNFLLQTTGENATLFGDNVSAALESTGTAAEQAEIRMEGPAEVAKRMAANVVTFMQDIGGPAASTLGPFLLTLNQLGPLMGNLVTPARALGGALGAVGGKGLQLATKGLGNLATSIIPKLASGLGGGLTAIVPMLGGAVSAMISGLIGLISAALPLLAAAWPLLLVGAIIAGIVLIMSNPEIRDGIFEFVGNIIGWIGDVLSGLGKFLGDLFGKAFDFLFTVVKGYIELITLPWRIMFDVIKTIVTTGFQVISTIFSTVFEFISNLVTTVFGVIQSIVETVIGIVTGIIETQVTGWGNIFEAVSGVIGGAVDVIVGVIEGIIGVVNTVTDVVGGFFDFITGGADKASGDLNRVQGAATPTGQFVPGNRGGVPPPGYQQGTMYVPKDGLAFLHRGEAVLPPDIAQQYRSSAGYQGEPHRGTMGNTTINEHNYYQANVQGVLPVRSVRDIGRGLRLAGETGQLVERRKMRRAEAYAQ